MAAPFRQRRIIAAAIGLTAAAVGGYLLHQHFRSRSLCEATADGASLDELTRIVASYGAYSFLLPSGRAHMIEHTTSGGYSCSVEVQNGDVVSAKAL